MSQSQGVLSALLMEPAAAPHTFDASSERYEFLYEDIQKHGRFIGGRGIRQVRTRPNERIRAGAYYVYGSVVMNVSPADVTTLMNKILGTAATGTGQTATPWNFVVATDVPYFGMLIDKVWDQGTGNTAFEYTDCKVNRAIISARSPSLNESGEPDLLTVTLQIIAKTETETAWPGSPPSLPTDSHDAPYVMSDGVCTLRSETRELYDFDLIIDNHLQARFGMGSLTATSICATDRTVKLRAHMPWSVNNHDDLYDELNSTAIPGTLVFTNGSWSTTFTLGQCINPTITPAVKGKREIPYFVDMDVVGITTTKEIEVDNVDTAT